MWRLFYPLRYFALENSEKRHIDLWPTLILTVLIAVPFIASPTAVFFGQQGFLDKLLLLTAALSGFYVAALLAAATFPHPDLDKVITVGPIKITSKDADGDVVEEHLTRREFTTTVFGYLAFSAFVLSIFSAIAVPLSGADLSPLTRLLHITVLFSADFMPWWHGLFICIFSALTAHLAVVTGLGLYYLMGRMYRRDPKVITKKPEKEAA